MARIATTKSPKPVKLTRAERQKLRIALDAILDAATLKEERIQRSTRRSKSRHGQHNGAQADADGWDD